MRTGRPLLLILSISLLVFTGCGKQGSSTAGAQSSAEKPAAKAPGEPAECPDEARALDLYERWQAAREVKLTPEDLAALSASPGYFTTFSTVVTAEKGEHRRPRL